MKRTNTVYPQSYVRASICTDAVKYLPSQNTINDIIINILGVAPRNYQYFTESANKWIKIRFNKHPNDSHLWDALSSALSETCPGCSVNIYGWDGYVEEIHISREGYKDLPSDVVWAIDKLSYWIKKELPHTRISDIHEAIDFLSSRTVENRKSHLYGKYKLIDTLYKFADSNDRFDINDLYKYASSFNNVAYELFKSGVIEAEPNW